MQGVGGDGAALQGHGFERRQVAATSSPPGAWRLASDKRVSASQTLTISGGMKARPRS